MAVELDTDQVAVGDAVTIPGLAGILRPGEKYEPSYFGLSSDAELNEAIAKLGLPLRPASGAGLSEAAPDDTKVPSATPQGDPVPPAQPDGDLTRVAVATSDEAEAARAELVNATDSAAALAAEKKIDLAAVEGSGAGGKVTKADVEAAAGSEG